MFLQRLSFCDMASVCSAFSNLLDEPFEWEVVQIIFVAIIAKFKLSFDDLKNYIVTSLPTKEKLPKKFFALHSCACGEVPIKHFVVKQAATTCIGKVYTINFKAEKPEITKNNVLANHILTHILICILRTRESLWANSTSSTSKKLHEIAAKLSPFIVHKPHICISSSSDSDSLKENSPIKKSLKRIKKSYKEESEKAKKIKVVPSRQRNFVALCKSAMVQFQDQKESLLKYIQSLPFTVDLGFLEVDNQILSKKVADLFSIKAEQDSEDVINGTAGCKTGELEAAFRTIMSVKSISVENMSRCRKSAELKLVECRENEERESANRLLAERLEAERVEAERREVEDALTTIAADLQSAEQMEPCAIPKMAVEVSDHTEDGEIGELERVRRYYCKAIKVAATYATALEQFVPALRPMGQYTLQDLKQKRANCRTALASNDDAITSMIHREQNGRWYGPTIPPPPTDLPDFFTEIGHIENILKQNSFNN